MKWSLGAFGVLACAFLVLGQQPPPGPNQDGPPGEKKDFKDFKKGGFKGGPMGGPARQLVKPFDKDGDGRLNKDERAAAREQMKQDGNKKGGFPFGGGKGGKGGFGREEGKPGPKVKPADVKNFPDATLYDPTVLRTIFLEFENSDWENEMSDFYRTDVEVPATLTVDGKVYPNVGVHFRGASSFFGVPAGLKRSMNLSMDFVNKDQRLYGYKTLNLLNSNDDPTFMHTTLYSEIARKYMPAPKANYVKLVVNGESWGIYVNAQQFNKEFCNENFGDGKGARWKVKGSPGGGGSLAYLGEDINAYKRLYEMKTNDGEKAWKDLIHLCKVLSTTPKEDLVKALEPILDIDGALRFLALDIALINDDGYWTRGSDFSIFRDAKGKFHIVPHDMNESFVAGGGMMFGTGGPGGPGGPGGGFPGGGGFGPPKDGPPKDFPGGPKKDEIIPVPPQRGGDPAKDDEKKDGPPKDGPPFEKKFFGGPGGGPGGGGRGIELDPLTGLNDTSKPLRSKLLAVPELRAKYLQYVRAIARDSLDWQKLGPIVKRNRDLIEAEIAVDTRKLSSLDAFRRLTADEAVANQPQAQPQGGPPQRGGGLSLRAFADQRRAYLLNYAEKKATP
jgi:spore coat protein CotH